MDFRHTISALMLVACCAPLGARAQSIEEAKRLFAPLPDRPAAAITPAQVELGRALFHEVRLSKSKNLSCNSCHDLATFGVDNEPVSRGHAGQPGTRNSPTVYNAAHQFAQFWDGRAGSVEEQALGPIRNPVEMGMESDEEVVRTLKSIPEYGPLFARAFPGDPEPITFPHVGESIGAFERTLITRSRFDQFLLGKKDALSDDEQKGFLTFVTIGCPACHNGVLLGGQMFQKLGVLKAYPTKDLGRYGVTGKPSDMYFFKIPTLRNIAKTGPYFHDGSVKTLPEAVAKMGEFQLGHELSENQVKEIVTFLGSLTGEAPKIEKVAGAGAPPPDR